MPSARALSRSRLDLLRGLPQQHSIAVSGERWPGRAALLFMLPPLAKPVRILSYCGLDPLMGRPFALKSGRPRQPLEIALPTKKQKL
jgi:hypothetical protein